MRITLATWVVGAPYVIALLLFVFYRNAGTPAEIAATNLTWSLYLAVLTAGYAMSSFVLIGRDMSKRNLETDFISCFWPYFCVLGLIEFEPRFRGAVDVLWASREDSPLLFQSLGLIFVPCMVAFFVVQALMDPELGYIEVDFDKLKQRVGF